MDERKKAEIVELFKQAKPKEQPKQRPVVEVSGTHNTAIVADGNAVVIVQQRPRYVVNVKPGAIHITDEQAAQIKRLVAQVVGKLDCPFQRVWSRLNAYVAVPSYRLTPAAAYSDAERFLLSWMETGEPPMLEDRSSELTG